MASQYVFFTIGLIILCAHIEASKLQEDFAYRGTARRQEFPYNVAFLREYGLVMCSGSILSNHIILSAASCMTDYVEKPHQLLAAFQSNSTSDENEIVGVSIDKIILHPEYNVDGFWSNLALLRTVEAIEFSTEVQPIALPTTDLPSDDGQLVTVAGWGLFEVIYYEKLFCFCFDLEISIL